MPGINEIKKTRNDIRDIRLKIEEKYLSGINAKILSKQAPEINKKISVIESFLINPDEQIEFISSLESVAENNNISQTPRIEYDLAKKKNIYKEVPIKISTEGRFEDQLKYLNDLTNLEKTIDIESLDVRVISKPRNILGLGSDGDVYVSFFITAKTFWTN
ncbi:type 4a pilus biogenesis protein PilO [bacterium]|nr:type 4a pilus biogenesis protein PilO [bacterium]